jgi:hypothetical protein
MGHPSPCLVNLWPLWSLHQPSLQDLRDQMSASSLPKAHYPEVGCSSLHSSPDLLKGAELVSTRRGGIENPCPPLFEGPYSVLHRTQRYFRVDIGGQVEAASTDRLKPYLGLSSTTPTLPYRRSWAAASLQRSDPIGG